MLQDYQVDLYLRQHWFDPRLNHSEIKQVIADAAETRIVHKYQYLKVLDLNDPKLVQAIWKPEVWVVFIEYVV